MEGADIQVQAPLLLLPREIRDEILGYLVVPGHVFTSASREGNQTVRRTHGAPETYLDTRISLPVRPLRNALGICKQLREELLDHIAYNANFPTNSQASPTKPITITEESVEDLEVLGERARDDGTVRITMEILRPFRGDMWAVVPDRSAPSPLLLSLQPLLSRLRKIKMIVWGSWTWWRKPERGILQDRKKERVRYRRIFSDQNDVPQASQQTEDEGETSASSPFWTGEPDPLSVAISSLMELLPNIEEVNVDVLIHATGYWHWDLPTVVHAGIQQWLDAPIIARNGTRVRKTHKRLSVLDSAIRFATFYHRVETCDVERQSESESEGRICVRVEEGEGVVPDDVDWSGMAVGDPPVTKVEVGFEPVRREVRAVSMRPKIVYHDM